MGKRTVILLVVVGLLIPVLCIVGIFAILSSAYTETRVSAQVDEYRIDFVRETDPEFITTYFEIQRPDGKVAGEMLGTYVHGYESCPSISIEHVGSKLYFVCADEGITEYTAYFDRDEMALYRGINDTGKPIEDLYFHE